MARTQIKGDQILDNSITSADVADDLELSTLLVTSSLNVTGDSNFSCDTLELTGSLFVNGEAYFTATNLEMTGSLSVDGPVAFVGDRVEITGSLGVAGSVDIDASVFDITGSLLVNGVTSFTGDKIDVIGDVSLLGRFCLGMTMMSESMTLGTQDSLIAIVSAPSGAVLTLPAGAPGQFLVVKDVNGSTSANPVTVSGAIDGVLETQLNSDYVSMMLCWTGDRWSRLV